MMENKGLRETPQSRTSTQASRDGHEKAFGEFKPQGEGKKTYKMIDGKLTLVAQSRVINSSAYVMDDMQAYRSPLDGSIINSRSDHKQHKRKHGVIEVGNEKLDKPMSKDYNPTGIREDMMRTIEDLNKQARRRK